MVGRMNRTDVCEATIQEISHRNRVDEAQAERVEKTALFVHEQIAKAWRVRKDKYRTPAAETPGQITPIRFPTTGKMNCRRYITRLLSTNTVNGVRRHHPDGERVLVFAFLF
jgi:hypothetical protein